MELITHIHTETIVKRNKEIQIDIEKDIISIIIPYNIQ